LLFAARDLDIRCARIFAGSEGFGRGSRIHLAHFFEPSGPRREMVMAVSTTEARGLFDFLAKPRVPPFFLKTPIELDTPSGPQ
jgi:hypothetical protein